MNWQCRLYGHQWRHPGTYEVVLVDGIDPSYPFKCDVCGNETLMDATGAMRPDTGEWESVDTGKTAAGDSRPELESQSESDRAEEPPDE